MKYTVGNIKAFENFMNKDFAEFNVRVFGTEKICCEPFMENQSVVRVYDDDFASLIAKMAVSNTFDIDNYNNNIDWNANIVTCPRYFRNGQYYEDRAVGVVNLCNNNVIRVGIEPIPFDEIEDDDIIFSHTYKRYSEETYGDVIFLTKDDVINIMGKSAAKEQRFFTYNACKKWLEPRIAEVKEEIASAMKR